MFRSAACGRVSRGGVFASPSSTTLSAGRGASLGSSSGLSSSTRPSTKENGAHLGLTKLCAPFFILSMGT